MRGGFGRTGVGLLSLLVVLVSGCASRTSTADSVELLQMAGQEEELQDCSISGML